MKLAVRSSALLLGALGAAAVLSACASASPPPSTRPAQVTSAVTAAPAADEAPVSCDLVCEQAVVVPRPADGPDYHALATDDANKVLTAMHGELLACYAKRVAASPNAHAFLTVDLVIAPDGRVRDVSTTGGALLGPATMSCLEQRFRKATFARPHGGGTLRIQVPFSLRRVAAGEDI